MRPIGGGIRLSPAAPREENEKARRLFVKKTVLSLPGDAQYCGRIGDGLSGGLGGQREARKQLEKMLDPREGRGQPQRDLPAIA